MHQDFVLQNDGNMMLIFRTTIDQLVASFNGIMNTGIVENWLAVGGGIIGGIFAIIFTKLFVPETKGKSLEEIEQGFIHYDRKSMQAEGKRF